jgi:competence protein ComFC
LGCKTRGALLDGLLAMQNYEASPLLVRAIHGLKYQFFRELAKPLGLELRAFFLEEFRQECFEDFWDAEVVFCPIPLSVGREKSRGFNQARVLIEQMEDFPVMELLRRVHFRSAQKELNKQERAKNILGAFQVTELTEKLLESNKVLIVLVDDVATTLATLEEATKVLKNAGFPLVISLVLARKY